MNRSLKLLTGCVLASCLALGGAQAAPQKAYFVGCEKAFEPGKVIHVIGHMNPDSDTVCSSIAYANLLNRLGYQAEPNAAGKPNGETAYALRKFGVPAPRILADASHGQFVIVDHSLYSQSIPGMKEANVLAVIDHHSVGDIKNAKPMTYIALPLGCTSTIIYREYLQNRVRIDRKMAGMMLTAILSDTLGLKSPTTTAYDRAAVKALMPIAGVRNCRTYTNEILQAGSDFTGMTVAQIIRTDFKKFSAGSKTIAIGVVQSPSARQLADVGKQIDAYMARDFQSFGVDMIFMMMVNIDTMTTNLLCYGKDALATAQKAYGTKSSTIILKDTVSRKTQAAPQLSAAAAQMP